MRIAAVADILVGDVVSCRRSFLLVVKIMPGEAVLCPFISMSELRHRADLDLCWVDLADANLPIPDMRLRGVPCRKQLESLTRIGRMQADVHSLIMRKITEEMRQIDRMCFKGTGCETIGARRRILRDC